MISHGLADTFAKRDRVIHLILKRLTMRGVSRAIVQKNFKRQFASELSQKNVINKFSRTVTQPKAQGASQVSQFSFLKVYPQLKSAPGHVMGYRWY